MLYEVITPGLRARLQQALTGVYDIERLTSRAAAETHADQLGLLVDGDSDLLSATLRDTLIRWIVDYNVPGARLPSVWRERPADAKAEAETRKAEAEAARITSYNVCYTKL